MSFSKLVVQIAIACALGCLPNLDTRNAVSAFSYISRSKLSFRYSQKRLKESIWPMSSFSGFMEGENFWENESEKPSISESESLPLKPLTESKERRERLQREQIIKEKYLQGENLMKLRKEVQQRRIELKEAMRLGDVDQVDALRNEISWAQSQDAEFVYRESQQAMRNAILQGDEHEASELKEVLTDARKSINHFNLEGLWVGKYGKHGFEIINVTYSGDTLIAYKVTGDKNVPKGEITFTANLTPDKDSVSEPIKLPEKASKQWGVGHVLRFPGEGQIASEGFKDRSWVDGQLFVIGKYFSYIWTPQGTQFQIFFTRPSGDLTLKMFKESHEHVEEEEKELSKMRELASKCLEETYIIEDEEKGNPAFCLGINRFDDDVDQNGCFE